MKTSENRKFEEEWNNALDGAEMAPSENVWNSIDLKLAHAESGKMKKRVLFYQRLAAASILFALCLGAAGWFWNSDEAGANQLATNSVSTSEAGSSQLQLDNAKVTSGSENPINSAGTVETSAAGSKLQPNQLRASEGNQLSKNSESGSSKAIQTIAVDRREVASLNNSQQGVEHGTLLSEQSGDDWRNVSLATTGIPPSMIRIKGKPVEQIESARTFKIAKKEEKHTVEQDRNWWASLNGSGGAYNQSSSSNSVATSLFQQGATTSLNTVPKSTEAGVGTSFSYGMSLGKKVAKRWVVMGGVNYLNQSIDYNSNIVLQDASQSKVFVADLASPTSNLASTAPYVLRNTNEFISVPLQAGYLLVNRKAGVQLNAGVAADIFYRNTMTDLTGQFGSFSQGADDNSVYRNLNWTGLLGTELSYKMNKHYQVSLLPGFRYSFNSVLKSSTGSTINPLVWDVGFRLKYVF
jgi:hypothetical protein